MSGFLYYFGVIGQAAPQVLRPQLGAVGAIAEQAGTIDHSSHQEKHGYPVRLCVYPHDLVFNVALLFDRLLDLSNKTK